MRGVSKTGRRVEGELGEETWIKETWIKGVPGVWCVWGEASNKLAQVYFCWGADRGQWGWVPMPMFKGWTELEKANATDGWILNKIKYRNLIDSGMQIWFDERAAPLWTIKWKGRCVVLFKNLFLGLNVLWLWGKNEPEWSVYNRLSLICTVLRVPSGTWLGSCLQSQCSELERQLERTTQEKLTVPQWLRESS